MVCNHPNLIIEEDLSGQAVHVWKNGKYDWSDENIDVLKVSVSCPDCPHKEQFIRGEDDIPDEIFAMIREARTYSHGGPLI